MKDIKPRLGLVVDINYSHAPLNSDIYGSTVSILAGMYVPGFFNHHSIYLRGGVERQQTEKYLYGNRLSFPRGYTNRISEKLNTLRADYYLPLFYPEFHIGGLLYVPRFHANTFYDYAKGEGNYYYNGSNWKFEKSSNCS